MKCIVIETSPERTNAHPVTNEDGTPHVYATMAEARAELKANGYSYNRENQRYYIKGTEYRAYILRADSEEYAKINAPYLIWEDDPETMTPENYAAEDAAYSLINAYADAIGEYPAETDPEYMAAFAVAGEEIAGWRGVADIHDRATVSAMVEAIADRAREAAAFKADDAAVRFCAALTEATGEVPYFEDAVSVCKVARDDIAHESRSTALDRDAVDLMTEAIAEAARKAAAAKANQTETAAADPEDLAEPAPIYQRYELLAYLGEPDAYDVDAIEAEATRFTADGARVWLAFGDDLAAIAERHELYSYAPAI